MIKTSWTRIHAWLARHAPTLLDGLSPPAPKKAIRQAEKEIGRPFPAPFRQSLEIHDGQSTMLGIFDGAQLLPLEDVLDSLGSMRRLVEQFRKDPLEGRPVGPVKPVWVSPNWVPITSTGAGRYDVLDFDPAPGGVVGQIVRFDADSPTRKVVAPGFDSFLEALAADLDQGRVVANVDESGDVLGLISLERLELRKKRAATSVAKRTPRKRP